MTFLKAPNYPLKNVQKKIKKLLTSRGLFDIFHLHTVKQINNMRTKTLLLTAAISAAGLASSMAQVTSVNLVGYVNVPMAANNNYLLNNPLDTGNNVLSNVFKGVIGGSTLNIFNGAGYDTYTYLLGHWKKGIIIFDNLLLPPGQGYFFTPSADYTNTFVGSVVANVGASVTNALAALNASVGSLIPYSGVITNGGTFNLGSPPGGTVLNQYNVAAQNYAGGTFTFSLGKWKQGLTVTNPVIAVAEGFFIAPSASFDWIETLAP